ncbi:MAG TPA: hypothetical protein VFX98_05910 [Longimicrobiaceae bacterium]|nr:hypothetical protein [Longimicrobiaceae bacterium]
MHARPLAALAVAALALAAACAPSYRGPVVEPGTQTVDRNTSWYADLASPTPTLVGVTPLTGSVSMMAGARDGRTRVALELTGASPGGLHPWEVRHGRCGADEGLLGPSAAYTPVRIPENGNASAAMTLPVQIPTTGSYFVNVLASAADGLVIACGNLAPPMTR